MEHLLKTLYGIGLLIIIFSLLMGCNSLTEADLPPGYSVLCSQDGKKFTLMIPLDNVYKDGGGKFRSPNVNNSFSEAVRDAINFQEYRIRPREVESDKYSWSECKGE